MNTRTSPRRSLLPLAFTLLVSPFAVAFPAAPAGAATFTILHTNDFHGQLELSGSNPGASRVAAVVNGVRNAVGDGWWVFLGRAEGLAGRALGGPGAAVTR